MTDTPSPSTVTRHHPAGQDRVADVLATMGVVAWQAEARTMRFTFVGGAARELLGFAVERWVEQPEFWQQHLHPEDRWSVVTARQQAVTAGGEQELRYRLVGDHGQVVTVLDVARLIPGRDGTPAVLTGVMRQVESAGSGRAAEQDGTLDSVVELCPGPAWIYDPESFAILAVNDAALTYLNRSHQELLGMTILEVRPPEDAARLRAFIRDARLRESASQHGAAGIWRYIRKDGSVVFADTAFRVVPHRGRHVILIQARDVTHEQDTRRALEHAEQVLSNVLRHAPLWVFVMDAQGRITAVDGQGLSNLGFPREQLVGRNVMEFHGRSEMARNTLASALAGTASRGMAKVANRYFTIHTAPQRDGQGQLQAVNGVAVDVTERVLAENALRQQTTMYEAVLQAQSAVGDGLLMATNQEATPIHVNDALCQLTGYSREELLALPSIMQLLVPEELEQFEKMNADRNQGLPIPVRVETVILHKSGRRVDVEAAFRAVDVEGTEQLVAVVRDVTERRRAESTMHETQRMESLAVLAGGLAHDFNNLLGVILGHVGMAALSLPEDSAVRPWLEGIESAGLRAAELCTQMLAFSGRAKMERRILDLNTLVRDTVRLLSVSMDKQTTVDLNLDSCQPVAEVDATSIRQVLMNLVLNANEALGHRPGTITVKTGFMLADAACLSMSVTATPLPEGEYAFVEVEDTGCGMDGATVERIFDPFFTTKPSGKGLGLAVVLGVVKAHRGALMVDSKIGEGTRFRVLLPGARGPMEAVAPFRPSGTSWRTEGKVLLADRDAAVRDGAMAPLRHLGLTVLTAADGQAALEAFHAHAAGLVAVIMDVGLSAPPAAQLLGILRQHRPDLPVLITANLGEEAMAADLAGSGVAGFMGKPLRPEDLHARIRKLLDRDEGTGADLAAVPSA